MSNRQKIKRRRSGNGRGSVVATGRPHPVPAPVLVRQCANCGHESTLDAAPDDGLPRINPQAALIRAHIADLEERLIEMAAADLLAATPEQARAVFDDPGFATEGSVDSHVRHYVYSHYAEGMDDHPPFVDRLSEALDEALSTADVGGLSYRVWDLPDSGAISPEAAP